MRPLVLSDNYFIYQGTKLNPLDVWDAISHPNHPLTPLAQLARRILSIVCPNSALVERLWSLFGTILTRLRTHLGNKALLNLAELKLYLREEHLREKSVQTRLKRSFGTALEDLSSGQIASPPSSSNITATTADAASAPTADVLTAQDASTCDASVADSTGQSSLRSIIHELIEAAEADDDEPPEPSSDVLSIPIKDLFDFTQSYWVEAYDKLAMRGLQDELELYELLDLDADGDTVENEANDALNE
jgi:hypothetical protein